MCTALGCHPAGEEEQLVPAADVRRRGDFFSQLLKAHIPAKLAEKRVKSVADLRFFEHDSWHHS